MPDAAVLKGTKDGYEIVVDENANVADVFASLRKLLNSLKTQTASTHPQTISFDVYTGMRLWSANDRSKIEKLFADYSDFSVHKITSDVITKEQSNQMLEQLSVHVVDKIIRNGQEERIQGDVLFLGKVHEGGKLLVSGNIYVLGDVKGIIQAGTPDFEDKMIIGDVHNAQQVRIGEQFEILDDTKREMNSGTVIYVNDLHVLDYGNVEDLKQINPKFFNQIGGVING
ncbi:septum site-determining protein MinC [Lentilactobacillus kisonensis]|uniref:Septum site-determining protein MinC n=2 Tax=Lentilactobacillus kisonensis TaxID=481722 RepID=A0A0R1NN52_9LACO|nr:septum site-determining protein MinC [Lentilactobacillus kisonensis]KRL21805.1 septum site-determining protein MinC [Lentilactobacillus kisonensis DSM 19906 = JCM 15041]